MDVGWQHGQCVCRPRTCPNMVGSLNMDLHLRLVLPIPRWLIPNPLLRWAVPKLIELIYPLFLQLNEKFDASPFATRSAKHAKERQACKGCHVWQAHQVWHARPSRMQEHAVP